MKLLFSRLFQFKTIKQRLRFWISFLILLTGLLNFVLVLLYEKNQHEEEEFLRLRQVTMQQQLFIENWLKERASDIDTLANIPAAKLLQKDKMKQMYEGFMDRQREFSAIVFVNAQGITELDTGDRQGTKTGANLSDRQYFKDAKAGKASITDVLYRKVSGQPVVIVSSPVMDQNQKFLGLVFGALNLTTIDRAMKSVTVGKTGESYLVGLDKLMITESRFIDELIQQGIVQDTTKMNVKIENYITNQAFLHLEANESYINYRGKEAYGVYQWIFDGKWLIINELDKEEIEAPFYRSLLFMLAIMVGVYIAGYIIIIIVADKLNKPLQMLVDGVQNIRRGTYHYRIEDTEFTTTAVEFRELCKAFNEMSATIDSNIKLLAENEAQYRLIAENMTDFVTVLAPNDVVLYASPSHQLVLERHLYIGNTPYQYIHPEDLSKTVEAMNRLKQDKQPITVELRWKHKNGNWITLDIRCQPVVNKQGEHIQTVVVSRDITERKLVEDKLSEAHERFKRLSTIDGLTQIANRRIFDETFERELHRTMAESKPFTLIMFDIDCFKAYNDTYGHQGGDVCLKEISQAINQLITNDRHLFARYGGEEFAIILPEESETEAVQIGETIRRTVEDLQIPHASSIVSRVVTVSVGLVSLVPRIDQTRDEILHFADKALYNAKDNGRNCLIAYT
ncbi:diguanylate cyclase domain-containing protein [Brevibacillus sp. SYSU BS000544]|uniref:diguanylate cyclase domain-containing protein n=1 Tax=Brevibacillus sp. SYSU BS000544 TaxID=3416443 RepID=UPI003CE4625F